jgi:flavodoxin I
MKTMIIYDSFYGNTEKVAQAMATALGLGAEARRVGDVQPGQLTGLSLLIVGSPTRAFRASPATVQLLGGLPANALSGVKVAAFDTRMDIADAQVPGILRFFAGIFGYAAKPIAARLQKKGGTLAAPPEGFVVLGSEGPLKEGELERAAEWARRSAATL